MQLQWVWRASKQEASLQAELSHDKAKTRGRRESPSFSFPPSSFLISFSLSFPLISHFLPPRGGRGSLSFLSFLPNCQRFLLAGPYETSSAAAALQNDFKKHYKRAVKGLAAAVANFGCFVLQWKALWQRCRKFPNHDLRCKVAAKWLRKDKECCYR